MSQRLILDLDGDSAPFTIGPDTIYFHEDDTPGQGIVVAHAATGEPYSRTNQYLRFWAEADAQAFLDAAVAQGGLPHGWQ